ncbi:MAG: hypothetical protein RHS_2792 [Robinsoniella sp. RHS]|nr:MAG: hypothetical protein RHS_2792 [Robinsoniella sp. RHS]
MGEIKERKKERKKKLKTKKKSSIVVLLQYAGNYRWLTILGCILSGAAAAIGLMPYVFVWLVARDALAVYPNFAAADNLAKWGWLAVWFSVANLAVYFIALMMTHISAFRTARNMRMKAMQHMVELPLGFFTGNQSGKLRKLVDDNAALTEDLLAHKMPDTVGAVVTPLAAIVFLLLFDWRMGALSLFTMVLALASMGMMMSGKNANFFHRYQQEIEKMSGEAVEYVRGIPVVKVFQQTVYSFKAFYAAILSYSDLAGKYAMSCQMGNTCFLSAINGTFLLLIPAALYIASVSDGWGVIPNFIFYALFAPACGNMINRIMYASQSVMEANEAVFKMEEVLSQEPLKNATYTTAPSDGTVEFKDVTFTYPKATRPALSHISFRVAGGQTVALVGPSGGGKTTAASLIPRFWDVLEGQVKIGGVDVREIDNRLLMDQVAFVFQDTRLFKQSLLDNIRAAKPEASREQVLRAAHAAQCDDILEKLPDGLDTVVGTKGIYLSGGEVQRIALARAILKDAPIIVLDEATAFADPENEAQIQKAFESLIRGKTVLMIAHRLSTIQNADNILVMDNGKITECGTHGELLEKQGLYAKMWRDYQKSAKWKVGKESTL